jgi:predicted HAD superfamily Cof-like phosphohydrolase
MTQVVVEAFCSSQDEILSVSLAEFIRAGMEVHFSNWEDVKQFHRKYGVPVSETPSLLSPEKLEFRTKFLREELNEFINGASEGNLEKMGDALIDLVYVALGTAHMMGLPWQLMWNEVQLANMRKVRATDPSQSKRGSALDVVKPGGWKGPDHYKYIGAGPWPTF